MSAWRLDGADPNMWSLSSTFFYWGSFAVLRFYAANYWVTNLTEPLPVRAFCCPT